MPLQVRYGARLPVRRRVVSVATNRHSMDVGLWSDCDGQQASSAPWQPNTWLAGPCSIRKGQRQWDEKAITVCDRYRWPGRRIVDGKFG